MSLLSHWRYIFIKIWSAYLAILFGSQTLQWYLCVFCPVTIFTVFQSVMPLSTLLPAIIFALHFARNLCFICQIIILTCYIEIPLFSLISPHDIAVVVGWCRNEGPRPLLSFGTWITGPGIELGILIRFSHNAWFWH